MDRYTLDSQRYIHVICFLFLFFLNTYENVKCTYSALILQSLEWNWALCQGRCGQDVKGSSMSKSSPCHDINKRESSWVVGVGEECHLLGKSVTSLHVGLSILLWQSSLGQRSTVEWQEDETSQSKGCNSGSSNNKVDIRDGLGSHPSRSSAAGHRSHTDLS